MEFQVVAKEKWETLTPPAKATKEDKYAKVLDALEAGEIVSIPTQDAKEAKGLRISIARKASVRGFRVDYRSEGTTLYIRKSDEAVTPVETKKKKEKVGV